MSKVIDTGQRFLAATEKLCDWMNGNEMSADHADSCPEDYQALCDSMVAFREALQSEAPKALSAVEKFEHPDCGRFYDENATRWACRAWAQDACAVDQPLPAAADETVYLIHFDDADMRPEIAIGEAAANARYEQVSANWNAHLFVKLDSNSREHQYANANYRPPASTDPVE